MARIMGTHPTDDMLQLLHILQKQWVLLIVLIAQPMDLSWRWICDALSFAMIRILVFGIGGYSFIAD